MIHTIGSEWLNEVTLQRLSEQPHQLVLSESAVQCIEACRRFLDQKTAAPNVLYYGINTGFGFLQNVQVPHDDLVDLQYNLLKSHACGTGDLVPQEIVRWMLFLKIQSLAYGHSGVQLSTVQRLVDFYNQDILPIVYTQGSLGASGDLAPLAHLTLPLIGLGEVFWKGKRQSAAEVLRVMHWEPIILESKEGLALINGTQFMSAYGVYILLKTKQLLAQADLIAAMSLDAFHCSLQPFHPLIHAVRAHKGQVSVAGHILELLGESTISQIEKKQVQDPYSFRCIPQVHGASNDVANYCQQVFSREINSVTDNPNIFPETGEILSGGNFHGQPLALSLDFLCMALAEMGSISERRTYLLLSGQRELPLFLIKNPGLHSGLMIAQYTAAAIASENKQLCMPASVDSLVSSNGQEDHVSMGANAAVKCLRVLRNAERILAIELLTAAQALDFRRPLRSAPAIEQLHAQVRTRVSFNEADRILSGDIEAVREVAFGA